MESCVLYQKQPAKQQQKRRMVEKPTFLDQQYRQYGEEVLYFITRHLDNPLMAEDLMQDVFLRASKTPKWESIENPRAYLFAVARNLLKDYYRNRKVKQQDNQPEFDEQKHGGIAPSEEGRLEARDELRKIIAAVKSLPPRAGRAFMLNRLYHFSYSEVGRMMNISPRTVENHVAYGLLACSRFLEDMDKIPETGTVTDLKTHKDNRTVK